METSENNHHWPEGGPSHAPEEGSVHVWRIPLTADATQTTAYREWLAEDERRRADRFLFDRHRHRFTIGRARMREVLAAYLNRQPTDLTFRYSNLGKPYLDLQDATNALSFNFSNSSEWALLAVTQRDAVGVDIEHVRGLSDMQGLAKRFFAPTEIAAILSPPESSTQRELFFRCWTRKEAFLKAVGKGLTFPLDRVSVVATDDRQARIETIDDDAEEAAGWSLVHLDPLPGYLGALALRRREIQVETFSYANDSRR